MESAMKTMRRVMGSMLAAVPATLLVLPASVAAQDPPEYEVTAVIYGPDCGPPFGLAHLWPWGLSDAGYVVGDYSCPAGHEHAFIWYGEGPIVSIPMPPGTVLSRAYDINSNGWVTGYCEGNGHQGFLFDSTTTTLLEMPPGAVSLEPLALNDEGKVVGYWQWAPDAFLWENGVSIDLGPMLPGELSKALDVNDAGMIAGWTAQTSQSDARAFIVDGETVTLFDPIPGGQSSEAKAVTSQGHFAGSGHTIDPSSGEDVVHALYWDGQEMIDLGTLPGKERSRAYDMTEDDVIVGYSSLQNLSQSRAFIWRDGSMYDLNDLAETGSIELRAGRAINEPGQIACYGIDIDTADGVCVLLTPLLPTPGDLDDNGVVNVLDLLLLIGAWGPCAPPPAECTADLNGDGEVNTPDLLILLGNWT